MKTVLTMLLMCIFLIGKAQVKTDGYWWDNLQKKFQGDTSIPTSKSIYNCKSGYFYSIMEQNYIPGAKMVSKEYLIEFVDHSKCKDCRKNGCQYERLLHYIIPSPKTLIIATRTYDSLFNKADTIEAAGNFFKRIP